MNFKTDDWVSPVMPPNPVASEDGGVLSKTSESRVLQVQKKGGQTFLILIGSDGSPHKYDAGLFKKNPVHAA
jgi:hypothetical protein